VFRLDGALKLRGPETLQQSVNVLAKLVLERWRFSERVSSGIRRDAGGKRVRRYRCLLEPGVDLIDPHLEIALEHVAELVRVLARRRRLSHDGRGASEFGVTTELGMRGIELVALFDHRHASATTASHPCHSTAAACHSGFQKAGFHGRDGRRGVLLEQRGRAGKGSLLVLRRDSSHAATSGTNVVLVVVRLDDVPQGVRFRGRRPS